MEKWTGLFVNGCEYMSLISAMMEYLNRFQDRRDASVAGHGL